MAPYFILGLTVIAIIVILTTFVFGYLIYAEGISPAELAIYLAERFGLSSENIIIRAIGNLSNLLPASD